jgi:hypothetical protein
MAGSKTSKNAMQRDHQLGGDMTYSEQDKTVLREFLDARTKRDVIMRDRAPQPLFTDEEQAAVMRYHNARYALHKLTDPELAALVVKMNPPLPNVNIKSEAGNKIWLEYCISADAFEREMFLIALRLPDDLPYVATS